MHRIYNVYQICYNLAMGSRNRPQHPTFNFPIFSTSVAIVGASQDFKSHVLSLSLSLSVSDEVSMEALAERISLGFESRLATRDL